MAEEDKILDTILGDDDEDTTAPVEDDPIFLPAVGMSIPVPRKFGTMVEKKYKENKESYQAEHCKWDKAFELYRQCGDEGIKLSDGTEYPWHFENEADENIVRNNVRKIMRSTYMQNPHMEFTDVTVDKLAESLEYIVQFLMNKKSYPGLNLKARARRWILHGQLTNFGVVRLDYQGHEGSREEAVQNLAALEEKLAKAKSRDEIEELYAQLEILHETLPLAENKGMKIVNVLPHKLIIDPNATMSDLTDAQWVMEEFDADRKYIKQKFYFKDEDGEWKMRSQPNRTTTLVAGEHPEDIKESIIDTVMNDRTEEQREIRDKNKVRCVYFYDKLLRRIHLFNTEDWKYPLWSWDDDLGLSRFFRHFILSFGETIDGIIQPGEVSYYVGQVNQVNQINRKAKQVRDTIFNTIVYNSKTVDIKEVQKLVNHLRNPRQVRAFGIGNDSEQDVNKLLTALAPPAYQFKDVFDSSQLRTQIDRAANISDVESGGQFRTNTTNEAIGTYAQIRQESAEVLIGIVEEAMEDLGWAITEILVSKYSKEEVIEMVGQTKGAAFQPMSVPEFNRSYRMEIAAGSIEKPNSVNKRQEAMQIAQALGQVANAAPGTALTLLLRMFKEAFTGFLVKDEDWAMLTQETRANLQKGVSTDAPPTTGSAEPQQ